MSDIASSNIVASVLERLMREGSIDRTQLEVFISKYAKAHELLTQAVANERVHAQNAADLKIEEQRTAEILFNETKKQSAVQAQMANLRHKLQEFERQNSMKNEQNVQNTNKISSLGEEKMLLQQQLQFAKKQRAEELQPKIKEIEKQIKELREDTYKQNNNEKDLNEQINQQKDQLEKAEMENNQVLDNLRRLQQDKQYMEAQPDKCRRQMALVKQGESAAQSDRDKRQKTVDNLKNDIALKNKTVQDITAQIDECILTSKQLKEEIIQNLQSQIQEQNNINGRHNFELQNLKEEQIQISANEKKAKAERDYQQKQVEDLQRETRLLEKKVSIEEVKLEGKLDLERPLYERKQQTLDEKAKEEERIALLNEKQRTITEEMQQVIIDYACELTHLDDHSKSIMQQSQLNKVYQDQIHDFVKEIRNHQIATISCQSQRQAANQRLGKISQALRQQVNSLQIKDTELERLKVENASLKTKATEFAQLYEKLRTQKNRLQRLSQEAKLAIQEVTEKIEVLKCETNVLTQESLNKQQTLQRQQVETKDAQRQAQTARQELSNCLSQLNAIYQVIARQLSEVKSLAENIVQKEKQIYSLKELYVKTIEQRNVAGVQLVQRNDELCAHYEKLHAQEAVQKEAEAYMKAREEDERVLRLMLQELFRDREILQRRSNRELPELLLERDALIDEVEKIRAENEDLLKDIRTTAAVKTGTDSVSLLDLTSLYKNEKSESQSQALRTMKKPPQTLNQIENKVYATWNMVGSLKNVDPAVLNNKQKKIEKYIQQVSHEARDKFNLDDELDRIIKDLQQELEQQKQQVDPNVISDLNSVRNQLNKSKRTLMSTVSQVQFQQMTCSRLEQVCSELAEEISTQRQKLETNEAPSEEIEHEWLVQHQNTLDYQRLHRMRQEIINSQVPGVHKTNAKPRFDSYVDIITGLPKPYGGKVPLEPKVIGIQQSRFVKKPKPFEIEL
ncbi:Conserved_hypothetical protein [Hexamita inflata]|uniref:Uncharacterized protein n=1 Tax=Hexamita inflata TaxID=28002 RepID=A0AA86UH44_9EUKA|nr:Conserved hypothetical protein [Hexamita inflata]